MSDAQEAILIACIGNIFLGDDGFGCEVARRLAARSLPRGVKAVDYGIRGLDLAYALLEPYDAVIFVDAIARGETPGTISLLEPAPESFAEASPDPHSMTPLSVLALAQSFGEIAAKIYIIGCEPADFGDELEGRMGLSDAVAAAVPQAADFVVEFVDRIRQQTIPIESPLCSA